MIPFFRRIRKKLADENQFVKYSRYAIGEIVLVVIGILIALSINNWNENRKKEVLEIQFLKRLANDLMSDTIYLNRRIKDSEKEMSNYYKFIHLAYEEQKSMKEFQELVGHLIFNSEQFVSQNSTYLELLNAGQLNIFKNEKLKNNMILLYKNYDIVEKHIKEYNEFSISFLRKAELTFFKYIEFTSNIFDQPKMFNKTEWQFINDRSSYKFRILEETAALYSNKHKVFKNYFIE